MRTPTRKTIKHLLRILKSKQTTIGFGRDEKGKIHSVLFGNGEFPQGVLFNYDTGDFIRCTIREDGNFEFVRICSPKQLEGF